MPNKRFDRCARSEVAPIVVGALLVTLAAFAAMTPATAASLPRVAQTTGCAPAPLGPGNVMRAVEGLPPVPGRTVSSCR